MTGADIQKEIVAQMRIIFGDKDNVGFECIEIGSDDFELWLTFMEDQGMIPVMRRYKAGADTTYFNVPFKIHSQSKEMLIDVVVKALRWRYASEKPA